MQEPGVLALGTAAGRREKRDRRRTPGRSCPVGQLDVWVQKSSEPYRVRMQAMDILFGPHVASDARCSSCEPADFLVTGIVPRASSKAVKKWSCRTTSCNSSGTVYLAIRTTEWLVLLCVYCVKLALQAALASLIECVAVSLLPHSSNWMSIYHQIGSGRS